MSSGRCGLCGNKFGQRAEELAHSDCVDEMNRKVDRLREELTRSHFANTLLETERDRIRERLDQFEAYAITVSSALADRAHIGVLRDELTLTRGAMAADGALSRARETEDGAVRPRMGVGPVLAKARYDEAAGTFTITRLPQEAIDSARELDGVEIADRHGNCSHVSITGNVCDVCGEQVPIAAWVNVCREIDRIKPEDGAVREAAERLSREFIEELRQRTYGPGKWSNDLEGDFGTWEAWRAALVEFAERSRAAISSPPRPGAEEKP